MTIEPETSAPPRRNRGKLICTGLIIAGLVLAGLIWVLSESSQRETPAWLTTAEFAEQQKLGPLQSLKASLRSLLAPLYHRIQGPQPLIGADAHLLAVPPKVFADLNLPVALTNASGNRLWILTPEASGQVRKQLGKNWHAWPAHGVAVLTSSGREAMIASSNPGAGQSLRHALSMDLIPRHVAGEIGLICQLELITLPPTTNQTASVRTNLAAACRMTIPSGASVMFDGGLMEDATNRYLVVLSLKLQDAKGNPINKSLGPP